MDIDGRLIVCIASAWDYDPTSKHHVMRILSSDNHVLWVNYHGTRRPQLGRKDVRGSWRALRKFMGGPRPIHANMREFTPLVIPGARSGVLRSLHERLLVGQIRRVVRAWREARAQPVQIWTFAPDVAGLIGSLGEECFVYYCVDDYTKFECHDRAQVAEAEARLLRGSDLVITTSEPLQAAKRAFRDDVQLVRHGVDYEHFAAAWRNPDRRVANGSDRRPTFGFFGLIQHWIDVDLIASVARLRPEYDFVLIGEAVRDVSALAALPNVRLLGRRPYAELPAYCATFDAGLLPFVVNEMTVNVNPIKMQEYLAAGIPVVSTGLPEARRFGRAVYIGDTADAFARACDEAIVHARRESRAETSRLVERHSWTERVNVLSRLVIDAVERRSATHDDAVVERPASKPSTGIVGRQPIHTDVGVVCTGVARGEAATGFHADRP